MLLTSILTTGRYCLAGLLLASISVGFTGCRNDSLELSGERINISWNKSNGKWNASSVKIHAGQSWKSVGTPSGEHTFLFSQDKPDSATTIFKTSTGVVFPEPVYRYQQKGWAEATGPVTLNTAGSAIHLFPGEASLTDNVATFTAEHALATVVSKWKIDAEFPTDILVSQILIAKKDGYFSLASPSLAVISPDEVGWVTVPGYFQSNQKASDFVGSYAYGHGIPERPVVYRERTISTLTAIVDTKNGASYSIIPDPALARDPWRNDKNTQDDWAIGVSHRSRRSELTPTLYYPVLGETLSKLAQGDSVEFSFRFSLREGTWFETLSHTVYDIYKFKEGLALRRNRQSLSDRVVSMRRYLTDTKTSMWKVETYEGIKIGAQSYLGGVVGSDKDAMKNADYGAMWMLARATDDPFLKENVLPYALNFKMKQQQTDAGFFQGAAIGQYYLAKRKIFVEEWGEFIEPVSLTYYTMLDMGNLMLFEPENNELKRRLTLGGDLLLKWQKADGSWVVAYDRETHEPLFTDIDDLRPTFYGLVVAYRLLKDEKYLKGAVRGADWLISNGVDKGHLIGVCGDARYAPDFATGQTAQALLDLYDITGDEKYRDAGIRAARLYTTSIYTHPVASRKPKFVNGVQREDWEIAQAGLSFEHGGLMGSAQRHGPIQLASHAGLFVRVFNMTNDSIFIDMARAAAIGRDAFVDRATSVASYYWDTMNRGAGPYPHHAWWQIGWITDYLMAEAELRSDGKIKFPRGFVTPKVGPHQTYGFEPGTIYGDQASLIIREGLIAVGDPNMEVITALSTSKDKLHIIVMNDINEPLQSTLSLQTDKIKQGLKVTDIVAAGGETTLGPVTRWDVSLEPYGIQVYTVNLQ